MQFNAVFILLYSHGSNYHHCVYNYWEVCIIYTFSANHTNSCGDR